MIKDTHSKVVKINNVRDTKQKSQRSVLIKNIAVSVSSILSFFGESK